MKHLSVFLKGITMGLADLVPGISGGTIALLLGIYTTLITSITDFFSFIQDLCKGQFNFKKINVVFLLPLLIGIATAILLGAKGINFLIVNYAAYTLSFFIGLIVASLQHLYIKQKETNTLFILIGMVVGILFLFITPATISNPSLFLIFISGFIAVAAMILPGISGSFLLLLIGMYTVMISYLADPFNNVVPIVIFIAGAILGLGVMSKAIKHLLNKFYIKTISLLIGLIAGALFVPIRLAALAVPSWSLATFLLLFVFILLGAGTIKLGEYFHGQLSQKN